MEELFALYGGLTEPAADQRGTPSGPLTLSSEDASRGTIIDLTVFDDRSGVKGRGQPPV